MRILAPGHAHILKRDGLSKLDVKRRLWEQSKLVAGRSSAKDLGRIQAGRRAELGEIGPDTLLPISVRPEYKKRTASAVLFPCCQKIRPRIARFR